MFEFPGSGLYFKAELPAIHVTFDTSIGLPIYKLFNSCKNKCKKKFLSMTEILCYFQLFKL